MIELQRFLRVQWDRATAVIAVILGIIVLLVGYWGVSGTSYVAAQLPYFVSGGLLGLFFLGLGGVAWISADLRDEWRELRALRGCLDRLEGSTAGARGADAGHVEASTVPVSPSSERVETVVERTRAESTVVPSARRSRPLRARP
jgi:hypothetical protein